MKSGVHWRNNDAYGMHMLKMADNTKMLAAASIILL